MKLFKAVYNNQHNQKLQKQNNITPFKHIAWMGDDGVKWIFFQKPASSLVSILLD